MPRRGQRRITVIVVGTPPPLPLRPFAMEVLRILEAKQAAEREAKGRQQEIETAPTRGDQHPCRRSPVNRLDAVSLRPAGDRLVLKVTNGAERT